MYLGVTIGIILVLVVVLFALFSRGKKRNRSVHTESRQRFPENQNPPRSAP